MKTSLKHVELRGRLSIPQYWSIAEPPIEQSLRSLCHVSRLLIEHRFHALVGASSGSSIHLLTHFATAMAGGSKLEDLLLFFG